MKKLSLSLTAFLPLAAMAQAASSGSSSDGFFGFILMIAVFVVLFLLLREVFCWYYKINERLKKQDKIIENQEKLIKILTRIAEKKEE